MDISNVLLNTTAIEEGVWKDAVDLPGVRLQVRGTLSSEYSKVLSALQRSAPSEDRDTDGSLLPEASRRVVGTAISEALLLGWEGLTNGDEPLPYSPDLALRILTHDAGKRLAGAVLATAAQVDKERAESYEDLLGN